MADPDAVLAGCRAIAVILVYGAYRALRPPFMDMSASSQEAMAYEEAAEAGEMQLHTTFMFVITASCSLVLIFYFMSGAVASPTCTPSVAPSAVAAAGGMPRRKCSVCVCDMRFL